MKENADAGYFEITTSIFLEITGKDRGELKKNILKKKNYASFLKGLPTQLYDMGSVNSIQQ